MPDRSRSPHYREERRHDARRDRHDRAERSREEKDHRERDYRDRRDKYREREGGRRDGSDDVGRGDSRRWKRREPSVSSDEDLLDLDKMGVKEIGDDDYFLKSAEFKHWLKSSRGKYLDEMTGDAARRYFRKFVKRWNDGALKEEYYRSAPLTSNTAYKWSFKGSNVRPPSPRRSPRRSHPPPLADDSSEGEIGPSLPTSLQPAPTYSDRRLAQEEQAERERAERRQAKKSDRREAFERADEIVPKAMGKEGKLAEKKAANSVNKEMREKEVGGLEIDEGTLMGGEESSFRSALKAREAATDRRADKRAAEMADRRAAMEERMAERKQKESATMDMLRAMAKERFG